MKQNMFFSISIVFILLVGVLTKHIFLASGMLIHELSVLIVILNAIRLVHYPRFQMDLRKLFKRENDSIEEKETGDLCFS